MVKNKIHVFEDSIFPRSLFVTVTDSVAYLNERFESLESDDDIEAEDYDMADAITFRCRHRKTGLYGVCVAFRGKNRMSVRTMAHEAVHVSAAFHHDLNMSMGFNIGEDEAFAYISGWAANCMNQVKTNKFRDLTCLLKD